LKQQYQYFEYEITDDPDFIFDLLEVPRQLRQQFPSLHPEAIKGGKRIIQKLKNLIERLVIMSPGNTITLNQLPQSICDKRKASGSKEHGTISLTAATFRNAKEEFEREFLIQKLEENEWNISRTAEAIEVERSNLHRKIKAYGIELKK
jgi:two-component system nitrogen regulation response regulator NtrX